MNPHVVEIELLSRSRAHDWLRIVVATMVTVAALSGSFLLVQRPAVVERLVVENQTEFDLQAYVVDRTEDALVPLEIVSPSSRTSLRDVIDVGPAWTIVLIRSGEEVGRVGYAREELAATDWTVVIPESLNERLIELGHEPCEWC
jgi:hypothetical protein